MYMVPSSIWPDLLTQLLEGENLSLEQATQTMNQLITGNATNAQIGAFLVALRAKGESVEEVTGFRDAVLANAIELPVSSRALDIVGTGGDRHHSINISTTAAIIASAAGIPVVKHGNRAASSASGSSDVLSQLGINLDLSNIQVAEVLEKTGITFAFAAAFHPGFRHVAEARRELGIPTIFNILGPLCNPARPQASAVGVAQIERIPLITGVFQSCNATALVFRGDDGLDELTTTTDSRIWEISEGHVIEHVFDPRDINIPRANLKDFRGGEPDYNARVLKETLDGKKGAIRDIVLLNAAAGLVAFNLSENPHEIHRSLTERFAEQIQRAAKVIDSGEASEKLKLWASASQSYN